MNIPISKKLNELLLAQCEINESISDYRIELDRIKRYLDENPEEKKQLLTDVLELINQVEVDGTGIIIKGFITNFFSNLIGGK